MPKAYWVNTFRAVHDEEKLAQYVALSGPAILAAGGRFVARGADRDIRIVEAVL